MTRPPAASLRRAGGVVPGLLVPAAVAVAAAVVDPHTTHVPLCPLNAVTGLSCPFCGSLRALHDLSRLHVGQAVHDNALLVAALPVLAAYWLIASRAQRAGRPRPAVPRWVAVAVVVLVVAFTVARNVPFGAAFRPV
jgi:hypothetical protein